MHFKFKNVLFLLLCNSLLQNKFCYQKNFVNPSKRKIFYVNLNFFSESIIICVFNKLISSNLCFIDNSIHIYSRTSLNIYCRIF